MPYWELAIAIVFALSVFSFASLAPWVPTSSLDLERIREIVRLGAGERCLEMGCGTAQVSLYLARHHPEASVTGVELSPLWYLIAKIRARLSGLPNVDIRYGNALSWDLREFDAIYVFGLPATVTDDVFPRIDGLQNPRFRLISYCFPMTNGYFQETRHKIAGQYAIYEYRPKHST